MLVNSELFWFIQMNNDNNIEYSFRNQRWVFIVFAVVVCCMGNYVKKKQWILILN